MTGRENVYLSGAIKGMSTQDVDQIFEAIVAFAEIGDVHRGNTAFIEKTFGP